MKNINELIQTADNYKTAVIQQVFKSKKNTVAYVTIDDERFEVCRNGLLERWLFGGI